MNQQEFDNFFEVHSQNVDNANTLGFWLLTDKVLETILLENMPIRKNIHIVDFGGGTGRWLLKLDENFTDSNFTIVDLSKDMLAQAREKVKQKLYTNQVDIIESDIAEVKRIPNGSVDYIMSTYNPLSFCVHPQKVINEAYRILKPGGKAMITVQGYHNALFSKINNFLASADELKEIFQEKKVRWTPDVPKLWQLPQEDMENMFKAAGFSNVMSRGIAVVTQPQGEDFDPENKQLGSLSKKLNEDAAFFETIYEIELALSKNQAAINRAMNIMTIGEK